MKEKEDFIAVRGRCTSFHFHTMLLTNNFNNVDVKSAIDVCSILIKNNLFLNSFRKTN